MPREAVSRKAARVAAVRASTERSDGPQAAAPGGPLELRRQEPDDAVRQIARALRARRPDLGEEAGEEAGAPYLAASLVAYASERGPVTEAQWCEVLAEVLRDASTVLDDDDNEAAMRWVIGELGRKQVLVAPAARIEEGALVLALLTEDDDWHEAVVQRVLGNDTFRLIFLEYGKPQDTPVANIRAMDTIVDDEGTEENLQEGKCEMCGRQTLLTFHHLIPKDTHATYLKKRLPAGIDGEPSRCFLNSYGTMVCRGCHSYVHRLASNEVLAREYNTLQKILQHPLVLRWLEWVGQRHA